MREKDIAKSGETASEAKKEPVRVCNHCGEMRNKPEVTLRRKRNGK